jgi:hypothetical protein
MIAATQELPMAIEIKTLDDYVRCAGRLREAIGPLILRGRNAAGTHEYHVSDVDFDLFTSYFVPPADSEDLNVIRHAS